jgi:hypothetical protein
VPIARSECPLISGATRGEQRSKVGGQVDVHVDQHGRIGAQPGGAQGPPAARLGQYQHLDAGQFRREPARDRRGRVGAGVLGDRDPERVRQLLAQVRVQSPQARLEVGLLVVHGDDDVDHRWPRHRVGAQRRSGQQD